MSAVTLAKLRTDISSNKVVLNRVTLQTARVWWKDFSKRGNDVGNETSEQHGEVISTHPRFSGRLQHKDIARTVTTLVSYTFGQG